MSARIKTIPAQQGNLDGACGFYAITNAIHLLEPDLAPSDIFRAAWKNFLKDGDPMRIIDGTTRGNLKKILSRTISEINESYTLTNTDESPYSFEFEIPYWYSEKSRERDDVLYILQSVNHRKGCVAIVGYSYAQSKNGNNYNHWTVIRESDQEGIVTHDSSGEKKKILFSEIRIDSFSQQSHSSRPYNIFSSDVFLIRTMR
jgi:hypothetical protein